MKRLLHPLSLAAALACFGSAAGAFAQAPSPVEDKLREQLKAVTLQLRTAQSDAATAAAEKAAAEEKTKEVEALVKKLTKEREDLTKEKAGVVEAARKMKETLEGELSLKSQELVKYQKSLDKWKASHVEISDIAKKKEAARASFATKNAALERRVADLRTRNQNLFNTANEILERFRKFSLGEAIAAREPFTGLTRVKLQNQLQEYGDKILDNPAPAANAPLPAAAPAAAPAPAAAAAPTSAPAPAKP
jgi:chromosome segregation ATPase